MEDRLKKLIHYGTKAPSGHNTQPWQFRINSHRIQIHPDFSRALPIVDTDNHALYTSLGCAAENIIIAATQEGLDSKIEIQKDSEGVDFINIDFISNDSSEPDELFSFIDDRQSTRNKYSGKKVPSEDLKQLKESFTFNEIDLMTFIEAGEIEQLKTHIIEGSNQQFQNTQFVHELMSWIRFSKKEAVQKRDGLWAASMGMPNVGRRIGRFFMKNFISAKSEAKRWDDLINASAGFALFFANKNDVWHWVTLGRVLQRFGLTATQLHISHAHVNMPCEEPEVRRKLAHDLNLDDKHPLLLLRFGYSDTMPYSFRRNVKEVITE